MSEAPVSKWFGAPIRDIPQEFLEFFCELVASSRSTLKEPGAGKFFIRLTSQMGPELLAWLFEKRFPLRPFTEGIDPKRIFPGIFEPCLVLRKRWRLLKKRVGPGENEVHGRSSALDATLADLRPLVSFMGRADRVKSAWRIHGKAVTAREAAVGGAFSPGMKHLYWGGAGSRKIAFWERLVRSQAAELSEIRRISHEVSRKTRRVTLSWHNASLGAAGGWAFEEPTAGLDGLGLRSDFVREVGKEAGRIRETLDLPWVLELCSMRIQRLFLAQLAHAEANASIASGDLLRGFGEVRSPGMREAPTVAGGNYEWPGALALHQRVSPGQVREWIQRCRKTWSEGLVLLCALANQGQRLLDSGVVDSFVLPWIDKFFISSRRRADSVYLGSLFRFVSATMGAPPVLFWDDTPHARAPSLGLALERMARGGFACRGVGIFNTGLEQGYGAERERAVEVIAAEFPHKTFFALRPLNENHCVGAFREIFENLDHSFFLHYDSSWKDNLAFLYAGTQVCPLLGVQREMETVSPRVVLNGKLHGFGAWFRRMLRYESLGENHEGSEGVSGYYCSWANLL